MTKSELISLLNEIPYDGEIDLLVQTSIDGDYWQLCAETVFAVEEFGEHNIILIRGRENDLKKQLYN